MIRMMLSTLKSPAVIAVAGLTFASSAMSLDLNYTATSDDGLSVDYATVNPVINVPGATSVSVYSHTFGPSSLYSTIPGTSFEFYDDYVFTIGASEVSSITATIDLSNTFDINGLNARLFSWNGNAEQLNSRVDLDGVGPNLLQAWTYATGTGDVAVINRSGLGAGTYVLQLRGTVDGLSGGAYVGTLQVQPVPIPAALPLLLSGLGLLGVIGRRRTLA
jgi:hypothetical protein